MNKKNNQPASQQGARSQAASKDGEVKAPHRGRHFPSKASPARLAALDVCCAVRLRDAFAHDLISDRIDTSSMSSEDRAFATLLVLGVTSSWGTLDEIIDRSLRSASDVQDDVRDALRIAVYEIIFLDKTAHAAVDQGVELVRAVQPRAAGLGNAALRKVVAMKPTFPFGDPSRDIAALARLHAFPLWLAKRLVADVGAQAAVEFMRASNEPAPLFIAVNEIKSSSAEVKQAFSQVDCLLEEVTLDDMALEGCFRVPDARILQKAPVKQLFAEGKLLVSDAASQLVAACVLPDRMPASFLEIGAGRGTKTILLQSGALRKYGSQMDLVALDHHAFKTKLLCQRAATYGVSLSETITGDATMLSETLGTRQFDAVFIDAPCSGLGTLRRHPEIRWRLNEQRINELAALGTSMLCESAAHVARGGQLCYATCTVTHAENNAVVKRFLESAEGSNFELAPLASRSCLVPKLTRGSSDAHFAVRFVRVGQ